MNKNITGAHRKACSSWHVMEQQRHWRAAEFWLQPHHASASAIGVLGGV